MKGVVILAIVQGICEWFPISSSGHLVFLQTIFKFKTDFSFDVFLHLSSLFAILIFFWQDIKRVSIKFFTFQKQTYEFKLGFYVIISSIITGIFGIFLKNYVKIFDNLIFLSLSFFFTSIMLFLTKFKEKGNKKFNFKTAILCGIFQGLALIPGVSRSGSTISISLISGINRTDSFKFSFLIAIPAILAAVLFEIPEIKLINLSFLATGFFISFFLSLISLYLLRKIFLKGKFYIFGFYTLFLSIFLFFIQYFS